MSTTHMFQGELHICPMVLPNLQFLFRKNRLKENYFKKWKKPMPKGKGKGFNFPLLSSTNLWITIGARQDPPSSPSAMGSLLPLGLVSSASGSLHRQATADFPISCDSPFRWFCLTFPPKWTPTPRVQQLFLLHCLWHISMLLLMLGKMSHSPC